MAVEQKKVQEAMARIDNAVSQLAVNRQTHLMLVNDLNIIQQCCQESFGGESKTEDKEIKK